MSSTIIGTPSLIAWLATDSRSGARLSTSASISAPETTSTRSRSASGPVTIQATSAPAISRARSTTSCSAEFRSTSPISALVISARASSQRPRRAASSASRAFSIATPAAAASATTMRSSCSLKSLPSSFSVR